MSKLIPDDFMLHNPTGYDLFHRVAKDLPIIDYHCHLSPKMIAENYRFRNAYDLFLGGDHYKWRQMRTHGIDEKYITGDAEDYAKFEKWAETLPLLIGNPLFHWNGLELARYFGIDDMLTPKNCKAVWDKVGEALKKDEYTARGLILQSNVEAVCTTDDPMDSLEYHIALQDFPVKVLPTFRPDKCVDIQKAPFSDYFQKTGCRTLSDLFAWLDARLDFFCRNGCLLADHGVDYVPYAEGDAEAVLQKKLRGEEVTSREADVYKTAVIRHLAKEYAKRGMAMQIHMGVLRNNNSRLYASYGPDAGCDSVADYPEAYALSRLLDSLDRENALPKTILYNLNPCDNFVLGTMLGNFQSSLCPGKIQFGSGWWFNDQKDGMETQMKTLASLGMLAHFVGMLTDSRSFVSYPRHEYFRRIFCNLVGEWVEKGEYPNDKEYLEKIVRGVCYENAKTYFGL
ncbi:MAG: glucuronate isomerase [Clostridia bacterium]|nr:glucuronate isomerase [Clostridia bacterium]